MNWGDKIRQAVIDLIVRGIEVANEQGQAVLTATASIYLAYMAVSWVKRTASTAIMIARGAVGGGPEADHQLLPDLLPDLHGLHGDEAARTSGYGPSMDVADEFAGDDEF